MTEEQSSLAFHLYIIEGVLTQNVLNTHMSNPKVNALLSGFTLEQINNEALDRARHANEQVGYDVF